MNKIRIAIDATPYNSMLHCISDYSGEQIYSKLSLPLFKEESGSIQILAAKKFEISHDNTRLTIWLKHNLFWSNGEKVVAEDYVRSIRFISLDDNNRFKTLFSDIIDIMTWTESTHSGIYSVGLDCLVINLKYPNKFFFHFLTTIVSSPLHKDNIHLVAGPYVIDKKHNNMFELSRNPYYVLNDFKQAFDKILYQVVTNENNLRLFYNGKIEVTCDTAFYYSELDSIYNHAGISANNALIMLLSPGTKFKDLSLNARSCLNIIINRKEICKKFNNVINPSYSYLTTYSNIDQRSLMDSFNYSNKLDLKVLEISYENYYPNKLIIEAISKQLEKYNVRVISKVDTYGKWVSDAHLRLEIRKSLDGTPILLYKSDLSRGFLSEIEFNRARYCYSKILTNTNLNEDTIYYTVLDEILLRNAIYIPLLEIPRASIIHESVLKKSIFKVGEPIYMMNWK